ncbi:hypothetical protein [Lentzea sp. NPDC060358]|uniref:hypothetical protein n=1 Tax=Lentzea sp. NPDC060358 TaxID=3347103 RepID=UPI003657699E
MWKIGFAFWASWQMLKWTAVAVAVLFVLYLWGGFNGAFVLAVLAAVLGLWGLKKTLGGYYEREQSERRYTR